MNPKHRKMRERYSDDIEELPPPGTWLTAYRPAKPDSVGGKGVVSTQHNDDTSVLGNVHYDSACTGDRGTVSSETAPSSLE